MEARNSDGAHVVRQGNGAQSDGRQRLMPMVLRLPDRAIETSLMQPRNASPPMEVTLLGRVSEVRKVQSLNDDLPIDVSDEGRPTGDQGVTAAKAESPMEVVPSGTVAWPFASVCTARRDAAEREQDQGRLPWAAHPSRRPRRGAVKRHFLMTAMCPPTTSSSCLASRLMLSGMHRRSRERSGPPLPMVGSLSQS